MRRRSVIGLALVCVAAAVPARGEVWEFVLDPARSRITATAGLNNGVGGADEGAPQAPGGDTASFAGVIHIAGRTDSIRFMEGSFADALPHPTPMLPGPGGAGAAPADYGWAGPVTVGGPAPRVAALRDLRFEFFSDPIEYSRPDGGFQNRVYARVGSGRADYTLNGAVHSFDFAGPDRIPGDDDPLGFLTSDGLTQTLTFSFYTTLVSRFAPDDTYGDYYIFHGDITATRVVPEPAATAPLLTAAALLPRRRRA